MASLYEFSIGLTLGGMVNVEEFDIPLPGPKSGYEPFAMRIDLGDHLQRGFGNPTASWRWGFLTIEQRDLLKAFCPGSSARVYIRTKKRDAAEEWANFYAVMIWPNQEDVRSERVLDFLIEFRDLIEQ